MPHFDLRLALFSFALLLVLSTFYSHAELIYNTPLYTPFSNSSKSPNQQDLTTRDQPNQSILLDIAKRIQPKENRQFKRPTTLPNDAQPHEVGNFRNTTYVQELLNSIQTDTTDNTPRFAKSNVNNPSILEETRRRALELQAKLNSTHFLADPDANVLPSPITAFKSTTLPNKSDNVDILSVNTLEETKRAKNKQLKVAYENLLSIVEGLEAEEQTIGVPIVSDKYNIRTLQRTLNDTANAAANIPVEEISLQQVIYDDVPPVDPNSVSLPWGNFKLVTDLGYISSVDEHMGMPQAIFDIDYSVDFDLDDDQQIPLMAITFHQDLKFFVDLDQSIASKAVCTIQSLPSDGNGVSGGVYSFTNDLSLPSYNSILYEPAYLSTLYPAIAISRSYSWLKSRGFLNTRVFLQCTTPFIFAPYPDQDFTRGIDYPIFSTIQVVNKLNTPEFRESRVLKSTMSTFSGFFSSIISSRFYWSNYPYASPFVYLPDEENPWQFYMRDFVGKVGAYFLVRLEKTDSSFTYPSSLTFISPDCQSPLNFQMQSGGDDAESFVPQISLTTRFPSDGTRRPSNSRLGRHTTPMHITHDISDTQRQQFRMAFNARQEQASQPGEMDTLSSILPAGITELTDENIDHIINEYLNKKELAEQSPQMFSSLDVDLLSIDTTTSCTYPLNGALKTFKESSTITCYNRDGTHPLAYLTLVPSLCSDIRCSITTPGTTLKIEFAVEFMPSGINEEDLQCIFSLGVKQLPGPDADRVLLLQDPSMVRHPTSVAYISPPYVGPTNHPAKLSLVTKVDATGITPRFSPVDGGVELVFSLTVSSGVVSDLFKSPYIKLYLRGLPLRRLPREGGVILCSHDIFLTQTESNYEIFTRIVPMYYSTIGYKTVNDITCVFPQEYLIPYSQYSTFSDSFLTFNRGLLAGIKFPTPPGSSYPFMLPTPWEGGGSFTYKISQYPDGSDKILQLDPFHLYFFDLEISNMFFPLVDVRGYAGMALKWPYHIAISNLMDSSDADELHSFSTSCLVYYQVPGSTEVLFDHLPVQVKATSNMMYINMISSQVTSFMGTGFRITCGGIPFVIRRPAYNRYETSPMVLQMYDYRSDEDITLNSFPSNWPYTLRWDTNLNDIELYSREPINKGLQSQLSLRIPRFDTFDLLPEQAGFISIQLPGVTFRANTKLPARCFATALTYFNFALGTPLDSLTRSFEMYTVASNYEPDTLRLYPEVSIGLSFYEIGFFNSLNMFHCDLNVIVDEFEADRTAGSFQTGAVSRYTDLYTSIPAFFYGNAKRIPTFTNTFDLSASASLQYLDISSFTATRFGLGMNYLPNLQYSLGSTTSGTHYLYSPYKYFSVDAYCRNGTDIIATISSRNLFTDASTDYITVQLSDGTSFSARTELTVNFNPSNWPMYCTFNSILLFNDPSTNVDGVFYATLKPTIIQRFLHPSVRNLPPGILFEIANSTTAKVTLFNSPVKKGDTIQLQMNRALDDEVLSTFTSETDDYRITIKSSNVDTLSTAENFETLSQYDPITPLHIYNPTYIKRIEPWAIVQESKKQHKHAELRQKTAKMETMSSISNMKKGNQKYGIYNQKKVIPKAPMKTLERDNIAPYRPQTTVTFQFKKDMGGEFEQVTYHIPTTLSNTPHRLELAQFSATFNDMSRSIQTFINPLASNTVMQFNIKSNRLRGTREVTPLQFRLTPEHSIKNAQLIVDIFRMGLTIDDQNSCYLVSDSSNQAQRLSFTYSAASRYVLSIEIPQLTANIRLTIECYFTATKLADLDHTIHAVLSEPLNQQHATSLASATSIPLPPVDQVDFTMFTLFVSGSYRIMNTLDPMNDFNLIFADFLLATYPELDFTVFDVVMIDNSLSSAYNGTAYFISQTYTIDTASVTKQQFLNNKPYQNIQFLSTIMDDTTYKTKSHQNHMKQYSKHHITSGDTRLLLIETSHPPFFHNAENALDYVYLHTSDNLGHYSFISTQEETANDNDTPSPPLLDPSPQTLENDYIHDTIASKSPFEYPTPPKPVQSILSSTEEVFKGMKNKFSPLASSYDDIVSIIDDYRNIELAAATIFDATVTIRLPTHITPDHITSMFTTKLNRTIRYNSYAYNLNYRLTTTASVVPEERRCYSGNYCGASCKTLCPEYTPCYTDFDCESRYCNLSKYDNESNKFGSTIANTIPSNDIGFCDQRSRRGLYFDQAVSKV